MEYGFYVKHTSDGNVIRVCLYVDDILIIKCYNAKINKFEKVLMNAFNMSDF